MYHSQIFEKSPPDLPIGMPKTISTLFYLVLMSWVLKRSYRQFEKEEPMSEGVIFLTWMEPEDFFQNMDYVIGNVTNMKHTNKHNYC